MASSTDGQNRDVVSSTSSQDGVCRDYLRNVCRRGDRCRFLHPVDPTFARRDVIVQQSSRRSAAVVFCHDFQNAPGCRRGAACRFAHCTRQQEEVYRRTGLLPVSVQRKLAVDHALSCALSKGETPICIDFLKAGGCRRATGKCRYRHVTSEEFERELCSVVDSAEPETLAHGNVYRKRKAPSSVDNEDDNDDDDDDDDNEYRCIVAATHSGSVADAAIAQQAVYIAPAYNNLPLVPNDAATHLVGGNNIRLVGGQPSTAILPVAILPCPAAPLRVLTPLRTPAICDVTPVVPGTVAMGTNVICPFAQWL